MDIQKSTVSPRLGLSRYRRKGAPAHYWNGTSDYGGGLIYRSACKAFFERPGALLWLPDGAPKPKGFRLCKRCTRVTDSSPTGRTDVTSEHHPTNGS